MDSKLRECDLVKLRVGDLVAGGVVRSRALVVQRKTGTPVQFEVTQGTRESVLAWKSFKDLDYRNALPVTSR